MTIRFVVIVVLLFNIVHGLKVNHIPLTINSRQKGLLLNRIVSGIIGTVLVNNNVNVVNAVQGKITPATKEEARDSVQQLKLAMTKMNEISALASKSEYQKIGDILSDKPFSNFDALMNILVRSQELSAEDKISLGTIKRYGVVADAIIMIGGLQGALKAGGIQISKQSGLQEEIEDDEDDDISTKVVDVAEVTKYIKLSQNSLNDIYKIVKRILDE